MLLTGVERMARILDLICRQDARHRLIIALLAATVVSLSLRGRVRSSTEVIATWDAFVFCVLFLAWLTILTTPVHKLRSRAKEQDLSRLVIFVFVVVAACAALFAVGFLISVNKAELRGHFTAHLLLVLGTVIFSWSVVHTAFGLHYAHAFYGDSDEPGADEHAGGLLFPGSEQMPDYFDFAYFSFVIGMTCQVSDVQITSRRMRRLTLVQSVLSFGFNTVILALLINTVSSLL
jgi:Predicted membrane protein